MTTTPPSTALPATAGPQEQAALAGRASLQGRVALITGGAGGLGAALAQLLGEAGMRLALVDIDAQRLQDRAAVLMEQDIEALPLVMDIRDAGSCREAVQQTHRAFGRLDALVNNAAVDVTAPLAELREEDWRRILDVNLHAPLLLAKHASALMGEDAGHIVNIASTASKRAWPHACAYHATKWGLLGLSHALHAELRPRGIRVCAIVAGGMRTPFLLDRFPDIDVGKLQDPRHVAQAVHYVLSQPPCTSIPEMMVIPTQETSWP